MQQGCRSRGTDGSGPEVRHFVGRGKSDHISEWRRSRGRGWISVINLFCCQAAKFPRLNSGLFCSMPKSKRSTPPSGKRLAKQHHVKKLPDELTLPDGIDTNEDPGQCKAQILQSSKKLFDKVHPFFNPHHGKQGAPGLSFIQGNCEEGSFVEPGHLQVRRLPRNFLGQVFGLVMTCPMVLKLIQLGILTLQLTRKVCALMVSSKALPPSNLTFLANNKSEVPLQAIPKSEVDQCAVFGLGFLTEDASKCFKCWCESHKHKKPGDFEKDFLNKICWCCKRFIEEHPEIKVVPLGRHGPLSGATVVPNLVVRLTPRKHHEVMTNVPRGPQELFSPRIASHESDSDSDSSASDAAHAPDGTPICRVDPEGGGGAEDEHSWVLPTGLRASTHGAVFLLLDFFVVGFSVGGPNTNWSIEELPSCSEVFLARSVSASEARSPIVLLAPATMQSPQFSSVRS